MKKYKVHWDRSDYGHIVIEAESKEQAEELFMSGEFDEKDLYIKGGGFEIALPTELYETNRKSVW